MSYSKRIEKQILGKEASIKIIEYCLEQKIIQDDLTESEYICLLRALNELKKTKRIKMSRLMIQLAEFDHCHGSGGSKLLAKFTLRLMLEAAGRADLDTVKLHGQKLYRFFQPEQLEIIQSTTELEQAANSEYWEAKSKLNALKSLVYFENRKLVQLAITQMNEVAQLCTTKQD